jgi:MoxR-like ATPase
MARVPGAEAIYEAADQFRQRCLVERHSLLWPQHRVWTTANISSLWDAFIGHPDTSRRTFFEKWRDQLADQPEAIHRIAADTIAFYHLFPSNVGHETKIADVRRVISWKLDRDQPNFELLERAYSSSVGSPGMHYLTGRRWQVAFFLEFARGVLSGLSDPQDPTECKRLADEVRGRVQESSEARHVLLHLLFPDRFERIASESHKRQIVETFRDASGGAEDLDDALSAIRRTLTQRRGRRDLDFYDDDIRTVWQAREAPRYWVEKTIVRGRPDREEGPYSVGRVLWSPQRDRGGGDTYRFMRQVQPGDVILHLTDNVAFTGVSRAASAVEEFGGVPNTEWGEGPSYLVRLHEFVRLEPPLSREVFFASPYRDRLLELIESGTKNLFYNRGPALNQGAYLTPAPAELVSILDDAYVQLTGRRVTELRSEAEPSPERPKAGRTLLVGAARESDKDAAIHAEQIETRGRAASWWSFPLVAEKERAIADWAYLFVYSGQPRKQLTHRYHVAEYRTSMGDEGIECPWPDFVDAEFRGQTRAGPHKSEIFKTWFLVDSVEELDPPIELGELEKADGTPADPSALVGGFGLWRLREAKPWTALDELVEATNFTHRELKELESLLRQKRQIILEGPPGSGKTYIAELVGRYLTDNPLEGVHDERLVVIQFHQSYGYEDFVQGIRPETNDAGHLEYHVRDGIFKRLCDVAERNRDKEFVIIIDEINRGNISRVFGELLLLLEYRDKQARLPYAKPDDSSFSIPPNIYLIGTMNTTDRSLAQIDYALRRRFYFYRLTPVENGRAPVLERWLQKLDLPQDAMARVLQLFVNLNERVQRELGEHFQVGHSYFMDPDIGSDAGQRRVWDRAIMPLLEEYFYNRRDRATLLAEFERERVLGGREVTTIEPEELG